VSSEALDEIGFFQIAKNKTSFLRESGGVFASSDLFKSQKC